MAGYGIPAVSCVLSPLTNLFRIAASDQFLIVAVFRILRIKLFGRYEINLPEDVGNTNVMNLI